jgi:hypothetical protein
VTLGPDGTILVPTNQLLSPAGHQLVFPGRPTDLALSPDGKILAVKNLSDILLVRMQDRAILQTLPVPRGDEVVPVLNKAIAYFSSRRLPIFFSRDWRIF